MDLILNLPSSTPIQLETILTRILAACHVANQLKISPQICCWLTNNKA
jgi:hypothetical protein